MLGQIEHQLLHLPDEPQVLDQQTRATLMKLVTEQMSVLTRDGPITIQEVFGGETFLELVPAILSAGTLPKPSAPNLAIEAPPPADSTLDESPDLDDPDNSTAATPSGALNGNGTPDPGETGAAAKKRKRLSDGHAETTNSASDEPNGDNSSSSKRRRVSDSAINGAQGNDGADTPSASASATDALLHVEQAAKAKIARATTVPVESREVLRLRELGGIYDRQDARKAQRDSERGSTTAGTPTPEPPYHPPTTSSTTHATRNARPGTTDTIDPSAKSVEHLQSTSDTTNHHTSAQGRQDQSLAASDNEHPQQLLALQPIPGVHFPATALHDSSAPNMQFNAAKHYGASTEQWTHLAYAHPGRRERERNTILSSPASRGPRGRGTAAIPKGMRGRVPITKGRTSEPPQFKPTEPDPDMFEQYDMQRLQQSKTKYKRDRFSLPPALRPEDDLPIDEQPYPHERPQDPHARQPTPPLPSAKSTPGTADGKTVVNADGTVNASATAETNDGHSSSRLVPIRRESKLVPPALPSATASRFASDQRLWELCGAALGVGQGIRERKVTFALPDDHPAWTS